MLNERAAPSLPPTVAAGCTLTYDGTSLVKAFWNTKQSNKCCGDGVTELTGKAASLVDLELTVSAAGAKITLTGPSTVWYAAGFFAQTMEETPYTIVVDGAGAVTERRMANHAIGRLLTSTVTVVSNTVAAGKRTVVLSRSATVGGVDHANFSLAELKLPFISAIGSTSSLSYHKDKTASSLAMWPSAGQPVCLCSEPAAAFGSAKGTIKYLPTGEEFGFVNYCMPEPRESVLAQKNPTVGTRPANCCLIVASLVLFPCCCLRVASVLPWCCLLPPCCHLVVAPAWCFKTAAFLAHFCSD